MTYYNVPSKAQSDRQIYNQKMREIQKQKVCDLDLLLERIVKLPRSVSRFVLAEHYMEYVPAKNLRLILQAMPRHIKDLNLRRTDVFFTTYEVKKEQQELMTVLELFHGSSLNLHGILQNILDQVQLIELACRLNVDRVDLRNNTRDWLSAATADAFVYDRRLLTQVILQEDQRPSPEMIDLQQKMNTACEHRRQFLKEIIKSSKLLLAYVFSQSHLGSQLSGKLGPIIFDYVGTRMQRMREMDRALEKQERIQRALEEIKWVNAMHAKHHGLFLSQRARDQQGGLIPYGSHLLFHPQLGRDSLPPDQPAQPSSSVPF